MQVTMEPHSGPSIIGMLKSLWESAKAPGKAYNEGMTPDEMIKAGNDFALNMGAGGSIVPKTPNSLGVFGGRLAKTANLAKLEQAQQFDKAGVHPDDIWKATGWGKGLDGKWRFEIDDSRARMSPEGLDALKMDEPIRASGGAPEGFIHPELYKAYPQLKDTIFNTLVPEGAGGVSRGGSIGLSPSTVNSPRLSGVTLHELQHEIQNIEGFAKGNNPQESVPSVSNELLLEAMGKNAQESIPIERLMSKMWTRAKENPEFGKKLYKHMAGEVEARNVEKRQSFSPLARAMKSPWTTEDVPRASQILFGTEK